MTPRPPRDVAGLNLPFPRTNATAPYYILLRIARYFGISEGFFLGLQADYDLMERRRKISKALKSIKARAA